MQDSQQRRKRWLTAGAGGLALAVAVGSLHFRESPLRLAEDAFRVAQSVVTGVLYASDRKDVGRRIHDYFAGLVPDRSTVAESWQQGALVTAGLSLVGGNAFDERLLPSPTFVYESPDAPPLVRLREECGLEDVIAWAPDEYEAQLSLGRWVAQRFPERGDAVPAGYPRFDPLDALRAAANGEAYSCDVVSAFTVYAATSLGWPARMIVVSRSGSPFERCVAELWSNRFAKWLVLDTANRRVFEVDGTPYSAFELCHDRELPRSGRLHLRSLAPGGETGVAASDESPYFAYIHLDPFSYLHLDLRNDWLTRTLHRGSPAGGDRNRLWTARPGCPDLLTSSRRENRRTAFDWPVNTVQIRALQGGAREDGSVEVTVGLAAYAPYFDAFAMSLDDAPWQELEEPRAMLVLKAGLHRIAARVLTRGGPGPVYEAQVEVRPPA